MTTPKGTTEQPTDAVITRARARVDAVHTAALARGLDKRGDVAVYHTPHGEVRICRLVRGEGGNGVPFVEVWLAGDVAGDDPHFRIFNPPTLASDPAGDVVVAGRRYRLDPLAAIAEAVASNGGAVRKRRSRR